MIVWAAASAMAIIVGTSPAVYAAAPGFAIQPSQGGPFSTVSFTGSNFCGGATCQPVTVTFAGQEVARNIAVAADGSFHGQFEVPATPAGNQRVVASQPDSGISVTALFFASPSAPAASGSPTAGPTTTPAPGGPGVTAPPRSTVPPVTGKAPTSPARTTAPSTTATTTAHTTTTAHIASAGSPTHHQGGSSLPWAIVIAVAAVLLASGLGFWYYRRRRSIPPPSAT